MSTDSNKNRFEKAGSQKRASLVSEFVGLLKQNKKYWLIPIILMLLVFSLLILLGGTAAAPFIYTLF
ncbi:MAG: hypothetical protein JWM99_4316 [Verrucomicrobiales bacterium]|nr:hypothetical protein [Verrucomicrobiales bacterium]